MEALANASAALRATLQLALIPGIGPRTYRALAAHFGDAASVLDATPSELNAVMGIGPQLATRIRDRHNQVDVSHELQLCHEQGISVLTEADAEFPAPLRQIPDPPIVLFQRGEWQPDDALAIAVVGTRRASHYGIRQTERLVYGLADAGLTIVSGVARGVDAAAHRAAIRASGRTIGVLGSGLLNVYPPEHKQLTRDIAKAGALLSELPPRQQPMSGTFPQRNRLISGLSLGVLVIEAAQRSGALITTSHAANQGRDVFAVPGPVDNRTSRGCHRLIRDGAKLVETVEDVLEELGPLFATVTRPDGQEIRHPAELRLNNQERDVLNVIPTTPIAIDTVVARSQLPVQRVLATLSVLELRHLIDRLPGNQVARR